MLIEKLNFDTDSLHEELNGDFSSLIKNATVFKPEVVFNNSERQDTFIEEIVFVDWIEKVKFGQIPQWGTRVFVSYHHATNPTLFEVLLETGRLLKEINML